MLALLIACVPDPAAPDLDTAAAPTPPARDTAAGGFAVTGLAFDPFSYGKEGTQGVPAAEGLCVYVADPTPALATGSAADLGILGATATGASGTFTLEGIDTTSLVGLFLVVDDCDPEVDTVATSITGVGLDDYLELGDGEILGDQTALVLEASIQAVVEASLPYAGYTGSYLADGGMIGFLIGADGIPVSGATVVRADGQPAEVYYADSNPLDGLFTTGGVPNASSDALVNGMFLVPGAPLATWTAVHDTASFEGAFFGTVPGVTTFFALYGV